MGLVVIDDRRWLSEETRVVRGNNQGLRAIVDAQTTRFPEVETEVLEERGKD